MKILFCNDYGAPVGGAENYILSIERALSQSGHEIGWLVSDSVGVDGPLGETFVCKGHQQVSRIGRGIRELGNLNARRTIQKALDSFRPDMVHLHCIHQQLSESILRPLRHWPTVYTAHDHKVICPISIKTVPGWHRCYNPFGFGCRTGGCLTWPHYIQALLRTLLYKNDWQAIDLFLAPSLYMEEQLQASGITKTLTLYNCIETSPLHDRGGSSDDIVLFVGRLVEYKGIAYLVDAMVKVISKVPSARLVIIGEGPQENEIREAVKHSGIKRSVEFLGKIPREKIGEYHAKARVLVIPSLIPESFGIVALEALIYGTPVVASRIGALPELVQNGVTGLLVEPKDSHALADGILRILRDDKLRKTMERDSKVRSRDWSCDKHLDRLIGMYCSLTAQR